MQSARTWIPAIAVALLASTAAPASADTTRSQKAERRAERAQARFLESANRFGETAKALADWRRALADASLELKTSVDDLGDRMNVFLQVELRRALHAGQAWLVTALDASGMIDTLPAPPDLSALKVEPVRGVESSGFGWREDPITFAKKFHKGADYKADRGTPVYASGDGIVVFRGRQNGYGKVIYIDHGSGVVTRYAHLRDIGVETGQVVRADEQIGEVGSTGRTTGPHLHFEVRIDGRAVCPDVALDVGMMQRTQPRAVAWIAAMALVPEAQHDLVDAHGPPRGMKAKAGRPDRAGRTRRDRPNT